MAVSQYDKEHLSTDQQRQIDAITKAAEAGSMDWGTAHSLAEGIRSQAAGGGYSGGAAGDEYNPLSGGNGIVGGNSGNGGGGNLNNTDWYGQFLSGIQNGADYDTLNSYYQNRVAKTAPGSEYEQFAGDDAMGFMQQYLSSMQQNDAMQQIKDAIAQIQNQNYSYGGSAWDSKLDELAQAAIDFNYNDWTNSDQYKALADRYGYQGNLTMQDVLGQIASRTGGLASSYATTAAQQQYNDYMAQLESVARGQYADEKNSMLDNATLAQNMSETEYRRYLNELSAKQSGQSEALNALFNMMGIQTDAANNAYNRQQSEDKTEYSQALQKAKTLAAAGDFSGYAALGYTDAEIANLKTAYDKAQAASVSSGSRSRSSGSGGSSGGSTSGIVDTMVGMGSDTKAYEYLLGLGYTNAKTEQLWSLYESARDDGGSGSSTPSFSDYSEAVAYMKQNGVPSGNASGAMTKSEWARRKASYQKYGQGCTEVTSYDSYSEYLTAYVQYCIETYGG
jgi:hypothetical protein